MSQDPQQSATPTPRTDAAIVESILCTEGGDEECTVYPAVEHVEADFARQLETELHDSVPVSEYRKLRESFDDALLKFGQDLLAKGNELAAALRENGELVKDKETLTCALEYARKDLTAAQAEVVRLKGERTDWQKASLTACEVERQLRAQLQAKEQELADEREHVRNYFAKLNRPLWEEFHAKGTTDGGWRCLVYNEIANVLGTLAARDATIAGLTKELEEAKADAVRLAESIWGAEYQSRAPEWRVLNTVRGVISQIDNMYTGIRDQRDHANKQLAEATSRDAQSQSTIAGLRDALRKWHDGMARMSSAELADLYHATRDLLAQLPPLPSVVQGAESAKTLTEFCGVPQDALEKHLNQCPPDCDPALWKPGATAVDDTKRERDAAFLIGKIRQERDCAEKDTKRLRGVLTEQAGACETARQNCIAAKFLLEPIYGGTNHAPLGGPIAKVLDYLDESIDALDHAISTEKQEETR